MLSEKEITNLIFKRKQYIIFSCIIEFILEMFNSISSKSNKIKRIYVDRIT